MPAKGHSTITRKRKKTEDMEETPPKRVTRAKAAANSAATDSKAPKTTRITTASARIAAEAKAASAAATKPAGKSTRATKRKIQAEENKEEATTTDQAMEIDQPEPVKTRGRPKKKDQNHEENAPKTTTTRTRRPKAGIDEAVPEEAPKQRSTRTRATKGDKSSKTEAGVESVEEAPKRTIRARATTITYEPEHPAPTNLKITKKVTFNEDFTQDKENVPIAQANPRKPAIKETGLKAKPVRRAAPTRAVTRATKAGTDTAKTAQPLSPKKITQVAKSSSTSSEDELCKSPIKKKFQAPSLSTPRKEVKARRDENTVNTHNSETTAAMEEETITLNLLASPAKRPPTSPFKDALKESPKKFPKFSPSKTLGEAPDVQTQFKDSMKRSPKKLGFALPVMESQDGIGMQPPSFSKGALWNSPVRRPKSPMKIGSLKVSGKMGPPMPITNTTSALRHMKSSSLFNATPKRLFGTLLKASQTLKSPEKIPKSAAQQEEDDGQDQTMADPLVEKDEETTEQSEEQEKASPIQPPRFFVQDIFSDTPRQFRYAAEDDDSEDELQSGTPTLKSPIKNALFVAQGVTPATKTSVTNALVHKSSPEGHFKAITMTPLAVQMSNWFATSPEKANESQDEEPSNIFLPVGNVLRRNSEIASRRQTMTPPGNPTFFEEQIGAKIATPSPQKVLLLDTDLHMADPVEGADAEELVPPSQGSEQYGDENMVPVETSREIAIQEAAAATEGNCVTPARVFYNRPREVYTVSKVPLKGITDQSHSALKVPKKRSKSLAGPLVELDLTRDPLFAHDTLDPSTTAGDGTKQAEASTQEALSTPQVSIATPGRDSRTPSLDLVSIANSPFKSARKGAGAQILRGAVVHVDVHTSEGADASGIFIELLTAMGAKCIRQWTWNPRVSMAAGEDPAASSKVGITHVVFKDGSKRTLQKVREAKGLVLCVGVGWVLE